ncbi:hypothetical protein MF271_05060 [Deinococcus sp. KNUC1210]|uniref:hypothetical protein n=1 Tax=Deinococcus sp. KNUC1210 TaxID=2917691 RepID=UPI001EF04AF3|nr:hypothetical protein [Deinococcus sp. KNUC1210]ULH16005.1 hypothetical protein MF271_05060 [Deinococcus sp. KNUC1210]
MSDLFIRSGWYAVKTDAAQISRGTGRGRVQRGTIQLGFPDMLYLLSLPGTPLCLTALVELKTATGRLRDTQTDLHQHLRQLYGLNVQVVRDVTEVHRLIAEGKRLRRLFKEEQVHL